MTEQTSPKECTLIENKPSRSRYRSIYLIWLYIFAGFLFIVWFGSRVMHKIAESDPKVAFIQGKQFYEQGKTENAMRKFMIAVQSEPNNYLSYYYLAKLYWQKNDAVNTLGMLKKYSQNHPGILISETVNQDLVPLCKQVATYYITQQNWINAREAYDIAGNSVNNVAEYLQQLQAQYTVSSETTIRNKIWPQGIGVTLEDFENTNVPVLHRWVINPTASIDINTIVHNPVYCGNGSERLKIRYTTAGPDYWAKDVYILLQSPLAIRVFITGNSSTRVQLIANMRFAKTRPEQKIGPTGACFSEVTNLTENQWIPLTIPDIYAKAIQITKDPSGNYSSRQIQLEMVAVNTLGNDCDFYIDNIEVYLPKS
ncbi:MAG: tetratricopeptide repeat protein [bacterium]